MDESRDFATLTSFLRRTNLAVQGGNVSYFKKNASRTSRRRADAAPLEVQNGLFLKAALQARARLKEFHRDDILMFDKIWTICLLIWILWVISGTVFYAIRNRLGAVRGFYMAVNVGYRWGARLFIVPTHCKCL